MNLRPAAAKPRKRRMAFSLVEVTIALGIVSFAGVAILGLLSTAMSSLQESSFDTVAARIASDVRADLQQVELSGNGASVVHYTTDGQVVSASDATWVYQAFRSEAAHQMPGTAAGGLRRVAVQVVRNAARTSLPVDAEGWASVPATMPSKTFRFYVVR